MAAVTLPGYPHLAPMSEPPPADRPRRWWVAGLVAAWIAVLAGLGWWSVRDDPATVQEQRTIAEALPVVDRATAAMFAAADAPGRAVVLGPLRLHRDCRLTPVRAGVEATREVTVYVPAGRALDVLNEIAAGLPGDYRAEAAANTGGRRVGLHADAGEFVAIDAAADSDAQVLNLEASTGCRPRSDGVREPADASAPTVPASLRAALGALTADGPATVREVGCPDGGVGRTYTVDGVPAPADLGLALQPVLDGATVVRAEASGWAYRTGPDSVVVTRQDDRLRVTATTPCG